MDKDEEEKKGNNIQPSWPSKPGQWRIYCTTERTFSSGTKAEKEPRSLVRFLVGEEPGNVPWSQRFFLKFFFVFARANREAARRERKTFFSHSSPLRDSLSPLRCSLSLSRRKISRKTFGTRVLGTRLSGKFPADKTGPFSLGSQAELRIRFTLLSRGTSHVVYKLYVLQPCRIKFDL